MDCLKPNISGYGMPQNFVEKTSFADGSRTSKFAKVFYLESFPLYSIIVHWYLLYYCTPDSVLIFSEQ